MTAEHMHICFTLKGHMLKINYNQQRRFVWSAKSYHRSLGLPCLERHLQIRVQQALFQWACVLARPICLWFNEIHSRVLAVHTCASSASVRTTNGTFRFSCEAQPAKVTEVSTVVQFLKLCAHFACAYYSRTSSKILPMPLTLHGYTGNGRTRVCYTRLS